MRPMWPADPSLRQRALDLYGAVWPHVPPGIRLAAGWGGDWFEVSTPLLVRGRDRILAHAGLIACDLAFRGQPVRVAALHGVCVHPDHRGHGLARRVLEEALTHAEQAGFETVILWSEKLDLYRRFGFEPVPECRFVGALPEDWTERLPEIEAEVLEVTPSAGRRVDLLRRLLRQRMPVSEGLAAADRGWHFWIDLGLWKAAADVTVVYVPAVDSVVVCELAPDVLRLYDVITASMPSAEVLLAGALRALAGVDGSQAAVPERLEIFFTPDRLGLDLKPALHSWEDMLMVRGRPLPGTSAAFALSPLTRT